MASIKDVFRDIANSVRELRNTDVKMKPTEIADNIRYAKNHINTNQLVDPIGLIKSFPLVTNSWEGVVGIDEGTELQKIYLKGCDSLTYPSAYSANEIDVLRQYSTRIIDFPNVVQIFAPTPSIVRTFSPTLEDVSLPLLEELPDGQTFQGCTYLSKVNLNNLGILPANAFKDTRIEDISLNHCTSIGDNAFYNCSSLKEITLPACSQIGYNAFGNCNNLASINLNYPGVVTFTGAYSLATENLINFYGTVYVPSGLYSSYLASPVWSGFASLSSKG